MQSLCQKYSQLARSGVITNSSLPQHLRNAASIAFESSDTESWVVVAMYEEMILLRSSFTLNDLRAQLMTTASIQIQDITFDLARLIDLLSKCQKPLTIDKVRSSIQRIAALSIVKNLVDFDEIQAIADSAPPIATTTTEESYQAPKGHPLYFSGMLFKFGRRSQLWQTRHCVIEDGLFMYFDSGKDFMNDPHHPRGVVPLNGCHVTVHSSLPRPFAFMITPIDFPSVLLAADSEKSVAMWCEALMFNARVSIAQSVAIAAALEGANDDAVGCSLQAHSTAYRLQEHTERLEDSCRLLEQQNLKLIRELEKEAGEYAKKLQELQLPQQQHID
eukprot:c12831_g1_i1.p1 GENE.c12831_g1_i1~~c12831_g1_i1.p1  ORF type:complete len:332 (-),score=72.03 c12831_g1_i1:79-1074(-)